MSALVITSTVYVNSNLTVLTDPEVRIRQYIDSILFYLNSKQISDIIVCDNSGYDYSTWSELRAKATAMGKGMETLGFIGDAPMIRQKGKGFGEGEIMSYVMANSEIIKGSEDFYKITGRLLLMNIDSLIAKVKPEYLYFQRLGLNPFVNKRKVDTRFYHCRKDLFKQYFLNVFRTVDDANGYYLEHAFYDQLKRDMISYKEFGHLFDFSGISGSTGESYAPKRSRWFIERNVYAITKALGLRRFQD
jgi:hypothetical protein